MSSPVEITSKRCAYGCGIDIYWNTSENTYFEVFSRKKHICPNRSKFISLSTNANTNKPTYYNNNKFAKQPKPKISNSLELLQGPIADIQKKYEILSDIITEMRGKTPGSQSHIMQDNNISLLYIMKFQKLRAMK